MNDKTRRAMDDSANNPENSSPGFHAAFDTNLSIITKQQRFLTAEEVAAKTVAQGHWFKDGRCYGQAMTRACRDGMIRHFDARNDQRISRNNGLQRVWVSLVFEEGSDA